MKSMDFFAWQGAGGVNSESIHDDCNAARRKKTRFHGAFMGWDWYYCAVVSSHGTPGAVAEPAKHLMQRRVWKACSPKVYACKKLFINHFIPRQELMQRLIH
jgi:hypothetical protein